MTTWHARQRQNQEWLVVTPLDAARHAVCGREVRLGEPDHGVVLRRGTTERMPHVPHRLAGRPLCRACHRPCPPGRRTFCGQACVDLFGVWNNWGLARAAVRRRDHGVCYRCGVDAVAARDWWHRLLWRLGEQQTRDLLDRLGWPFVDRDWWEADHIVARRDGGTDHPDNLRTLCVRCHKHRTAEQRRRWARERRERDAGLFADAEKSS